MDAYNSASIHALEKQDTLGEHLFKNYFDKIITMTSKYLFLLSLPSIFLYAYQPITFTQNEQKYLKEKKEITVCFSPEEGKHVGILAEVMYLLEKKLPVPVRYVPVKTEEECISLSKAKKVDLAAMIITSPNRHTHLMPGKKVIDGSLGIATKINEPQLLSIINKAIDSVDEQEIRDIVHKWIAVRVEKGFDHTLMIQVASFLLVIVLVSFYWVRKLLKEVRGRKEAEQELKNFNKNLEKEITSKIEELHFKDAMLLEKTKLAAMGEMLGAIAHQWRRPLSTLHINVEMLEEDYKENKIDHDFLEEFIKKNCEIIQYMSHTIDDFQNFYMIDKEKRLFDVMKKIKSVSDLQLNQLEQNGIKMTQEGESFTVFGYPSEFQQVILTLISNAKDAFIEKEIKKSYIKINVFSDGSKGYIRILDNAGGIDEKTIGKIFEPYFTTKEKSAGTGLGLYISKMIIEKNMHGTLAISNKGEGSEVLITLDKEIR